MTSLIKIFLSLKSSLYLCSSLTSMNYYFLENLLTENQDDKSETSTQTWHGHSIYLFISNYTKFVDLWWFHSLILGPSSGSSGLRCKYSALTWYMTTSKFGVDIWELAVIQALTHHTPLLDSIQLIICFSEIYLQIFTMHHQHLSSVENRATLA